MDKFKSVVFKVSSWITIDSVDEKFKKNIGSVGGELSEDQIDDLRMLVSDVLPQSGRFEDEFGSGKFFIEVDDIEVEELG